VLRFLADENFNGRIVRGLELACPLVDLVRAQDEGLDHTDDPTILKWAADAGRILLTHDLRTMVGFARDRIIAGEAMPGVIAVRDTLPIGTVIEELTLIVETGLADDFDAQVVFLPL
jgi:predicted nuclease of predicted toxin-antitoxin system